MAQAFVNRVVLGNGMSDEHVAFLLLALNLIAFLTFWLDKQAAMRGEWRIRESTLLWIAFLGGSSGAVLAQQIFRHKTRKEPFRSQLLAIALLHLSLALFWLFAPSAWIGAAFRIMVRLSH